MGQRVAALIPPILLGGCSLIYNPNNITSVDAKTYMDAMVDANAAELALTSIDSPTLLEGQGDGGSRPAVLVVRGANITSAATITVAATTGVAMVETVGSPVVSKQSDLIAIPVIAHVDTNLAASTTKELTVTVSQPTPGGMVTQMLPWQLQGLGELEPMSGSATLTTTTAPFVYSRVNITGTLTFSGTEKAIIHATSSISINAIVGMSATGQTAGPGGFNGGAPAGDGAGPGKGTKGNATTAGGGGAGFTTAGGDGVSNGGSGGPATGDVLVTSYMTNAGSGGGGATNAGGGGGGTIELTAAGTLSAPAITAKGASVTGNVTTAGGGGSGGVIVLRSGAAATLGGALNVDPGTGGAGLTSAGGDGRAGRARVDAVSVTGSLGPAHRGVMFDTGAPVIARMMQPEITVIGTPGDRFDLHRVTSGITSIDKTLIDLGGSAQLAVKPASLTPGFNRLCAVPENASLANDESRNCIDVAYLP